MNAPPSAPDSDAARRAGLPPGSRLHETRLANGLTIAAAEVPGARRLRLVAAVDVGYLDEPDDCRGLAHLLEHALFLGSTSFPDAGELASWVGERGGRYNARTDESVTDVHLQLPPDAADEGLARLVDMLARPGFEAGHVAREVEVLEAEFQARLADPALHRLAALGRLCREGHAARHCHAGNRATLASDATRLSARLVDFHARHYRAGHMALVMLGPLPLEAQRDLLVRHGTALEAADTAAPQRKWRWGEPDGVAWRLPESGSGLSRGTALELFWPLPDAQAAIHGDWLASVAARLSDGRLAATLQAAVELERLEVTLAPEGMGSALALQLSPATDLETVQTMLDACRVALERAIAAPLPDPPAAPLDLDTWPRRRAARLVRLVEDDTPPDESGQQSPLPWLTAERCRLLWLSPATTGRWKTLAETGTRWRPQPPPSAGEPWPGRAPPTLPAQTPRPSHAQPMPPRLYQDDRLSLWTGEPIRLADAHPASLCLGWQAPISQQAARLIRWRQNTLPLRQAAAVHGMWLTCDGDARGDWLMATGAAERLGSLAELAVACWPEKAASKTGGQAEGLLAQRMLARIDTQPPPIDCAAARSLLLGWASGNAEAQVAEALLGRLAARLSANPPTDEPYHAVHAETWLPPQGDDHAVMLEIVGPDNTPASRWLLQLLAQCHDAAFHHEMRQRRALGYAAAVRYREASGFPRLGYVVQSPGTETGALRQAIHDFISHRGEALAHLTPAELARRKRGLLARGGYPETHTEAVLRLWQALRCQPAPNNAHIPLQPHPWQPLPWEAEEQALASLHPDQLSELAQRLAAGRLAWRWWLHSPDGAGT